MSGLRLPRLQLIRLTALLFLPLAVVAGAVLLTLPQRMNALALESARDHARSLAELTARLVAPALEFEAREEAAQALARLAEEPDALGAVLYDDAGQPFAHSPGIGAIGPAPAMPQASRIRLSGDAIEISTRVRAAAGTEGTLWLRFGLQAVEQRREANMATAAVAAVVVAIVGLFFSIVTAIFLVRRQTAEEELRRAAESFGALAESLPISLVIHRDECVVYANPAARDLLAAGRAIPSGVPLAEVFCTDRPLPVASLGAPVEERQLTRADGETLATALATVPIQFHGGAAVAIVAMDLTERNRLLERLVMTDRLASLGTMAAGVAHEINNPLAVVLSNTEIAREQLDSLARGTPDVDLAEMIDELDDIRDAARRIARIVNDLRSLTRPEDSIGAINVELAIDKALQMVGSQIESRAFLVCRYAGVPSVSADEGRLVQVFINLLVNAVQALPQRAISENRIEVSTAVTPEGDVVVTVRDNGSGIPPDRLDRIFDPFFTTKPVGVGTGLGLSIVHNLVETMGGRITVESREGLGTAFSVVLRASTQELPASEAVPADSTPTRRARLLIVDDERLVRKALERMLGEHHEVTAIASAKEALAHLEGGEAFDLILCDLRMPEMSGLELAAQLEAKRPRLRSRLFFMTGDQGDDVSTDELGPILPKPFTRRELDGFVEDRLVGAI